MASTSTIATRKFVEFLKSPTTGVSPAVAQLSEDTGVSLAPVLAGQIIAQNVSAELNHRSQAGHYPLVHVYVDRVRNLLTEKFRRFSGKIRTVAEIRVSHDRIEGVEEQTRLYVDAITQVLDTNRGSWGDGAFYTGGYEIVFEPVKSGGRGFLQTARVVFEVDLSS
jgi:hypothetical protein